MFASEQRELQPLLQTATMEKIAPTTDMMVDDVMTRWPATIRVFLNFRMRCVGCPIAAFHSVEDASREHKIDPVNLLIALRAVAN